MKTARLRKTQPEFLSRIQLQAVAAPKRSQPRAPFLALVAVILFAGISGLLAFNTQMQQAAFTETELQQQASDLLAQQQSLEIRIYQQRSSETLALAAQSIGMVPASAPAFLNLENQKIKGQKIPAAAANGLKLGSAPAPKPELLAPKPKIKWIKAKPGVKPDSTNKLSKKPAKVTR